jgi:hypothetical protein
MFSIEKISDPALHKAACRIANRFMFMVHPTSRRVDSRDMTGAIYAVLREELESFDTTEAEFERMLYQISRELVAEFVQQRKRRERRQPDSAHR